MNDLEKMAVKGHGKRSQLYYDYITLKQWYEEKFWQYGEEFPWEVRNNCINEMRKMLYALDISELKTLAERHDPHAEAVYAKRYMWKESRAEYDGNAKDLISKLEAQLTNHYEHE